MLRGTLSEDRSRLLKVQETWSLGYTEVLAIGMLSIDSDRECSDRDTCADRDNT